MNAGAFLFAHPGSWLDSGQALTYPGDKATDTEGHQMPRKRFNATERDVIAAGGTVEVQNVTQWHRATLTPGATVTTRDGWQETTAAIDATRGTVRAGDPWIVTPGHVRAVTP